MYRGVMRILTPNAVLVAVTVLGAFAACAGKEDERASATQVSGIDSLITLTSGGPGGVETSAGESTGESTDGLASFYARRFNDRRTTSGEVYDPKAMTMAHRSLPFGTWVSVTNLGNGRSVRVRVNDRGPWTGSRLADLSMAAARQLGFLAQGVARVRLERLPDPPGAP